MNAYPTWDEKAEYLAAAQVAMLQVAADVDADTTNVWQSIDAAVAELHKLRSAASSEQRVRHDAMVARMEAEDAARRARPDEPDAAVLADVQQMIALDQLAMARLLLMRHTSMKSDQARKYVDVLAGATEGVAQ